MSVEVKTTVKFEPWQVPNFASMTMPPGLKQDGIRALPTIAVADLDAAVLDTLANAWLTDLYDKAGKPCPFVINGPVGINDED